ncbi:hypothetical protein BDR03DRAFT_940732 [Suillus americanus]|nr:hypothetical protein BDR03DRAFT_940732 [Suillus americanus]
MWYKQYTIAWVIIATTVFGFLFYSLTVMAALVSPACPFQTPISTTLRILRVDKVLRPIVIPAFRYLKQLTTLVHGMLKWRLRVLRRRLYQYLYDQYDTMRTRLSELADSVFAACSSAWRRLQSLFRRLLPWRRSPTRVVDPEARRPDQNLQVVATNQCPLKLKLPDTPTSSLEAPSIKWLLETSTDPEVFLAAASLVPHVDWPLDLDVSDTVRQLFDVYTACLDVHKQIIPSLEEKASACTMALCHLYYGRVLQAYRFIGERSIDNSVFPPMLQSTKVSSNVLVATAKLVIGKYEPSFSRFHESPKFWACPDHVIEWLSRVLPFHFVTEQVDEYVKILAITVISKLLCSSPSPQTIANCTLLACVMVGVQFDKKDIVRVDKSSALPQLAEALWAQFQKVLWASDEDDPDSAVRQAWHFDVICRVLDRDLLPPPEMWKLGVCWKIYSRARSSQQNDRDLEALLLKVQRFKFAVDVDPFPWDPLGLTWLWQNHVSWQSTDHSPEDFDWLVDYLGDVFSNDHKTAGDILVLLSSMSVSCSPAKQRPYIEKLIACMGSSMPPRLRHAALRAAHSSREVFASMDVVDDGDMALTNFCSAILTAVCRQPGATFTDDGSDRFFHSNRDLCYLELIFALARNSYWRPHLHCQMNRSIRIITVCCKPYRPHAFYLVGIFLRMTSELVSATSLSSITEQQWWDMTRTALGYCAYVGIPDTHDVEFLSVLVEGTKKCMGVASKSDLEWLIRDVDNLIERLKGQGLLEHREGDAVAMKELRRSAKGMLDNFS